MGIYSIRFMQKKQDTKLYIAVCSQIVQKYICVKTGGTCAWMLRGIKSAVILR